MRVLIAGGGTGGHLIPALNIARELSARHPDADIRFVGTVRGIENKIVPQEGYPLELLPVVPLSRKLSWNLFKFPIVLLKSIIKTARLIKAMRAEIVIATGGYVAGPAVLAGWLRGIPIVINEQNSYPGLTTRVASLFATKVCLGLPGAKKYLWKQSQAELTGNPVEMPPEKPNRAVIRGKYDLEPDRFTVLVTGGSQGASSINNAVIELLKSGDFPENAQMIWQTGEKKFDAVLVELDYTPSNIVITPFIRPMWEAYYAADIIVARCGALTLSEISIFGLPAILVPYPFAAADHQRLNALSFAKEGAAIIISDEEISGKSLANILNEIIGNEKKREKMAKASEKLGRPSALNEIVGTIEKLLTGK